MNIDFSLQEIQHLLYILEGTDHWSEDFEPEEDVKEFKELHQSIFKKLQDWLFPLALRG